MAGNRIHLPENNGQIEILTIPDPGVGNNFSYTVPDNCMVLVNSLSCRIQPGFAGLGNRYFSVLMVSAGVLIALNRCPYGIADLSGTVLLYAAGNTEYFGVVNSIVTFKLQQVLMNSGCVFRSDFQSINVSDAIDQIRIVITIYKEN
jgi:hypothetical protein